MGRGRGNRKNHKANQARKPLEGMPKTIRLNSGLVRIPEPKHGFRISKQNGLFLINGANKKNGWKEDQGYFRSLLVDKNGKVVSSGFPKFFNYDETSPLAKEHAAEFVDAWKSGRRIVAEKKMDGTLVIRSVIDGKVVWRTRGTFDGGRHRKPVEALVAEKNPGLMNPEIGTDESLLFEFLSADHDYQNVLKNGETELIFLDRIDHRDLKVATREEKEWYADRLSLKLVDTYDIEETGLAALSKEVRDWENEEGLVLRVGQTMLKVKSRSYLELHRLKHGFDDQEVERQIREKGIGSKEEWVAEIERQGGDHELIKATEEVAGDFFENSRKAEEKFDAMLDEVDMIAIRAAGKREAAVQEINSTYVTPEEREAALLIFDGREGPAEDKLKKLFG